MIKCEVGGVTVHKSRCSLSKKNYKWEMVRVSLIWEFCWFGGLIDNDMLMICLYVSFLMLYCALFLLIHDLFRVFLYKKSN